MLVVSLSVSSFVKFSFSVPSNCVDFVTSVLCVFLYFFSFCPLDYGWRYFFLSLFPLMHLLLSYSILVTHLYIGEAYLYIGDIYTYYLYTIVFFADSNSYIYTVAPLTQLCSDSYRCFHSPWWLILVLWFYLFFSFPFFLFLFPFFPVFPFFSFSHFPFFPFTSHPL